MAKIGNLWKWISPKGLRAVNWSMVLILFISLGWLGELSGESAQAEEPVKVTATVDRNSMEEGDTFTLQVTVESEGSVSVDEPRLPSLKNMDLINSWSASEVNSTYTNGQFLARQSKTFNYMLAPKEKGKVTIPSFDVAVNGKSYSTNSIDVTVKKAGSIPSRRQAQEPPAGQPVDPFGDDVDQLFSQLLRRKMPGFNNRPVDPKESFFIQLDLDKTQVYEGEQITASWYIYTRSLIRDIDTLKYPSLSGFWKEEIDLATRLDWQTEVLNGLAYKKALLVSYALFPMKAGKAKIDSYKAKCAVMTDSGFGFGRQYFFTKASQPADIEVRPVPSEGRPADYSGAVGQFNVTASVSDKSAAVNQPVTLKVRFDGRGNGKMINLPKLNLPSSIEIYDTKTDAKFFKNGQSYKEFEVLLIPREQGAVTIPALTFSLFDPVKGQFYQRVTQEIPLTILPGTGDQTIADHPLRGQEDSAKVEEENQAPTLPPLVLGWENDTWQSPLPPLTLWLIVYVAVVLGLGGWTIYQFGWTQKNRDIRQIYRVRAQKLNKMVDKGEWRMVGVEGINLVYFVLGEVSEGRSGSEELDKLILKVPPSVRREVEAPLRQTMSVLEALGFAPEELVGSLKEKKELVKLVKKLDGILHRTLNLANTGDMLNTTQDGSVGV